MIYVGGFPRFAQLCDSAVKIGDMDVPGWQLHELKGKDKGTWAVSVNGNWRVTFEFKNGDAFVVDYKDYH